MRVLLVDPDHFSAAWMVSVLSRAGLSVSVVTAADATMARAPDAVVLGPSLSPTDVVSLAHRIRANAEGATIFVLSDRPEQVRGGAEIELCVDRASSLSLVAALRQLKSKSSGVRIMRIDPFNCLETRLLAHPIWSEFEAQGSLHLARALGFDMGLSLDPRALPEDAELEVSRGALDAASQLELHLAVRSSRSHAIQLAKRMKTKKLPRTDTDGLEELGAELLELTRAALRTHGFLFLPEASPSIEGMPIDVTVAKGATFVGDGLRLSIMMGVRIARVPKLRSTDAGPLSVRIARAN